MMHLVDVEALKNASDGSYENVCHMVSESFENGTVLATFPQHVICETDGIVQRVPWTLSEDGIVFGEGEPVDVPVYNESTIDVLVGKSIRESVRAIFDGSEDACNRLHGLIPYVRADGDYWVSSRADRISEAVSEVPAWLRYYVDNRAIVRAGLRGSLGAIEKSVPSRKYSRLPESKLSGYASEIEEALDVMVALLSGARDRISGFVEDCTVEQNSEVLEVATSVCEEVDCLLAASRGLFSLSIDRDLPVMSEVVDKLSDRVKSILIISEFVARSNQSE